MSASSPLTGRPVRIRYRAWLVPRRRVNRIVPPSTRGTPHRRQKTPNTASSAATRRSHHAASSMPPATAKPSTAAMTGFDSCMRVGPIGPSPLRRTPLPEPLATALRSAPAQNVPPAPVKMATQALSSFSNSRKAAASCVAVSESTALRTCGRLIVMIWIRSRCSTSIVIAFPGG